MQALKRGEKQQGVGVFYRNIFRILKVNFQQNLYLHKVYMSYYQLTKKLKRFH